MTEGEALAILTDARHLLARIEASGKGIYYQPAREDQRLVEAIMHLCTAYHGPEHELEFRLLRQRAGLSPSGWGLVRGMVEQYALSLPGVAERRIELLRQYLGEGQ